MGTLEIPGDSLGFQVVVGSQMEDLLHKLRKNLPWVTARHGPLAKQPFPPLNCVPYGLG